jgi:molybdenum cofactor cytidylyltransferase
MAELQISAVVLAAGQSRRMGRPKQLEVVDGEPMVVRAAQIALRSCADRVLVVTGAYAEAVTSLLTPLVVQHAPRLTLTYNPAFTTGQASSIQSALQALPAEVQAVLFLPVDQPFLAPGLLDQLVAAWRAGAALAAAGVEGELRGAPALFDRIFWPELLQLNGDVGARPLLQRHRTQVIPIPADPAQLRDIDTPQDLPVSQ